MYLKIKKLPLFIFISILLLQSCTEDIKLDIIGAENKIVIEGSIENGKPAEIIVTRNSPVSKAVDYENILVKDAIAFVSNGGFTDTLRFTFDSASSIPLVYKGSSMIGVVGQTYNLTVIVDGKKYTATTTIPNPIALDSVWWKAQPPNDSLGYAWTHLSEPAGYGNAYRWLAKRASQDRRFIAPIGATFDDKFIDGRSFDSYFFKGTDPTATKPKTEDPTSSTFFYKNTDTIYIKFITMDIYSYKFYISYETALAGSGNPFASPTSIQTNISAGGLGVWAGFGVTYDTIMPTP